MKAYSQDLRDHLLAALKDAKLSRQEILQVFGVSRSFVQKLLRRVRETGSSAALAHGGGPSRVLASHESWLETEVLQQPDATLAELCDRLVKAGGPATSRSMMCRELHFLNLSRKKKVSHASEQDTPRVQGLRKTYWESMAECVLRHLIFIDETGLHLSFTRTYGRAKPGQRVVEAIPYQPAEKWTVVAALSLQGVAAPWVVPDSMNSIAFETYVEYVLAPTLQRGDIVVMDNLPAHKQGVIQTLLEARGARLQWLSPYSPDFNPIELAWAKVKNALRAAKARTFEALLEALSSALKSITAEDALAWFNHCGYGVHS